MVGNQLAAWRKILKDIGLTVTQQPRQLTKIASSSNSSYERSLLAFDGQRYLVMHISASDQKLSPSEVRSLLRRACRQEDVTSPCILTYGNDKNLAIFVSNASEEEVFQFVDVSSSEDSSEQISDIMQARSKTTATEKIQAIHDALNFENLSRRFFESAERSKDLIEKDIFRSMGLTANDGNRLKVSHYAIILMARLIFLHFLEQKKLLNHDASFIRTRVMGLDDIDPIEDIWLNLLQPLFNTLNNPNGKITASDLKKCEFPYLNGGLFAAYEPVEGMAAHKKLRLSDDTLLHFYKNCLYKYRLTTSEDASDGGQKGVLDPELLGTLFERFMKDDVSSETGSVYTPKDVVLYSVREALTRYFTHAGLPDKTAFDLVHKKEITRQFADKADKALSNLKMIDPCCGSGAFLLTALHELFEVKRSIRQGHGKERWHNGDQRQAYEAILRDNIFGMDINPEAIILCHLRLWLPIIDLIDGSHGYEKIKPLPNLGLNIREGNSLTNEQADWQSPPWQKDDATALKRLRTEFFNAENASASKIKDTFDEISEQDDEYVRLSRNFIDVTHSEQGGFSVIVGNPPYLGLKDTKKLGYIKNWIGDEKKIADMYIMFTKESLNAVMPGGVLSYVTSNTYFTDLGKKEFREILLGDRKQFPVSRLVLTELSEKTFKGVAVTPAIFSVTKRRENEASADKIRIVHAKDAAKGINAHVSELNDDPGAYDHRDGSDWQHVFTDLPVATIKSVPNSNLFIPTPARIGFLNEFGAQWQTLYQDVWPLIETSRDVARNQQHLEHMRKNLKPGDMTLIGMICDGGVGLQTGSNPVHLATLKDGEEGRRIQEKIRKDRADMAAGNRAGKKVEDGIKKIQNVVKEIKKSGHSYATAEFNYVHKLINQEQILDVNRLTAAEVDEIRENGISKKMARKYGVKYPTYVPYYKGQDSDFNRWLTEIDYYIDWSDENVCWLRENSGKKFTGAPVVRSSQFYFKPGFAWNDIRSKYIQSRIITAPGVNDVKAMKLNPVIGELSGEFLCAFLNSSFVTSIIDIVTSSVNTQINDIKLLPFIIPAPATLSSVNMLVADICKVIADTSKPLEARKKQVAILEAKIDEAIAETWQKKKKAVA